MNKLKRQAFLKVMDIQPYFPRQVLVGAKPSPAYELPQSVAVTGEPLDQPVAIVSKAEATPKGKTKIQGLEAVAALRAHASPARRTTVTPIRQEQQPLASASDSESSADVEEQGSLSFSLRYYRISDSLAVLDEMPPQGTGQLSRESQKLMLAILRALGLEYSAEALRAEEFSWPLQSGYSAKQSPQVDAAKALSGFLRMRQETDSFTNLLVFAGQLEDVLLQNERDRIARDFESDRGYFVTVTHSLASMLAIAGLKRDVWQHLQPLRKRLPTSGRQ